MVLRATITDVSIDIVDFADALDEIAFSSDPYPLAQIFDAQGPVFEATAVGATDGFDMSNLADVLAVMTSGINITGTPFDDTLIGSGGDDTITADDGNDIVDGGAGNDTITGGDGNDTITGGDGNDTINPGANDGYDQIVVSYGNDVIDFSAGNDNISYYEIDASWHQAFGLGFTVDGTTGTGNILIDGLNSTSLTNLSGLLTSFAGGLGIIGTSSDDLFDVNSGANGWVGLVPGRGVDIINVTLDGTVRVTFGYDGIIGATQGVVADLSTGLVSNDGFGFVDNINITPGAGRIELRGTNFDDHMTGHSGNDGFITEQGNDTVDGGDGFDRVRYDRGGVGPVTVDLEAGTATGTWYGQAFTDTLISIEAVRGSRDDGDTLLGSSADNYIRGMGGDDTIEGRGGNDTIEGGDGTDTAVIAVSSASATVTDLGGGLIQVTSSEGTDVYTGIETFQFTDGSFTASELLGGGGTSADDTLVGGVANDTINAGDGNDTVDGGDGGDLINGGNGNDSVSGGEGDDGLRGEDGNDTLDGGAGNDSLPGANGDDSVIGGLGDDRLGGGYGNDYMEGGDGNDSGGGGFGNDTIIGGEGDDLLSGGADQDTVLGNGGHDTLAGSFGSDLVDGSTGHDSLGGGHGHDTIIGGEGDDSIGAGDHNDTVTGDAGHDFIGGGDGNDTLDGGTGMDTLNGGYGNDVLTGGADADIFVFNNRSGDGYDIITDFEDGVDLIRLVGLPPLADPMARVTILDSADGTGADVYYGNFVIHVEGVSAANLTADDFLFT